MALAAKLNYSAVGIGGLASTVRKDTAVNEGGAGIPSQQRVASHPGERAVQNAKFTLALILPDSTPDIPRRVGAVRKSAVRDHHVLVRKHHRRIAIGNAGVKSGVFNPEAALNSTAAFVSSIAVRLAANEVTRADYAHFAAEREISFGLSVVLAVETVARNTAASLRMAVGEYAVHNLETVVVPIDVYGAAFLRAPARVPEGDS